MSAEIRKAAIGDGVGASVEGGAVRNVTSGQRCAVEWPKHPVGSMRWTYIAAHSAFNGTWERCEVVDVYGELGGRYGDYPELYDVRRPDGNISRGHFASSLQDQHP